MRGCGHPNERYAPKRAPPAARNLGEGGCWRPLSPPAEPALEWPRWWRWRWVLGSRPPRATPSTRVRPPPARTRGG
eukprot:scaffold420_cov404-Prasinococcus_capsulatus_cf.AAC.15